MIFPFQLFLKPKPVKKPLCKVENTALVKTTSYTKYDVDTIFVKTTGDTTYDDMRAWERENIPEIAMFRSEKVRFDSNKIIETNAKGEKLIITLNSLENAITETFYGKTKSIEKTTTFNEHSVDNITVKIRNRGVKSE